MDAILRLKITVATVETGIFCNENHIGRKDVRICCKLRRIVLAAFAQQFPVYPRDAFKNFGYGPALFGEIERQSGPKLLESVWKASSSIC